jgi:hypothetical protein
MYMTFSSLVINIRALPLGRPSFTTPSQFLLRCELPLYPTAAPTRVVHNAGPQKTRECTDHAVSRERDTRQGCVLFAQIELLDRSDQTAVSLGLPSAAPAFLGRLQQNQRSAPQVCPQLSRFKVSEMFSFTHIPLPLLFLARRAR